MIYLHVGNAILFKAGGKVVHSIVGNRKRSSYATFESAKALTQEFIHGNFIVHVSEIKVQKVGRGHWQENTLTMMCFEERLFRYNSCKNRHQ